MAVLKAILYSFVYAVNGITYALTTQRNMVIHSAVATLVIVFGLYFQISSLEWSLIIFCFGLVITAELFNTAVETICDLLKGKLKLKFSDTTHSRDLAAGAVLVASLASLVIGLIIFLPRFIPLFSTQNP